MTNKQVCITSADAGRRHLRADATTVGPCKVRRRTFHGARPSGVRDSLGLTAKVAWLASQLLALELIVPVQQAASMPTLRSNT